MSGDRPARPLRDAVVWGAVGALTFGILYQSYGLLGGSFDWRVLLAGMAIVGFVTTMAVPPLQQRLYASAGTEN